MITVLWVYEEGMLESQAHMIEYLRSKGVTVTLEEITLESPRWERLVENEVLDRHLALNHDFHVYTTHTGNPHVIRFQQLVKPRIGAFDIEHDLFHDYPERSLEKIRIGTFAFTTKHDNALDRQNQRRFRARWYKLDGPRFSAEAWKRVTPSCHFVADADAVVIGSTIWNWPTFRWAHHFHISWYKPFARHDKEMAGTRRLPDEFCNTQAVVDLKKVSRYWFTYESSCFAEALLFGCMPILCNERIIESSPVDDVVDRVKVIARDVGNGGEMISLLAVTQRDFDRKIKLLRDPNIYERVHKTLYGEYFLPNEQELAPAHHELWCQIELWWRSKNADHH